MKPPLEPDEPLQHGARSSSSSLIRHVPWRRRCVATSVRIRGHVPRRMRMVCIVLASGASRARQSHSTMADACRAIVAVADRTRPGTTSRVGHLFEHGAAAGPSVSPNWCSNSLPQADSRFLGRSVCATASGEPLAR